MNVVETAQRAIDLEEQSKLGVDQILMDGERRNSVCDAAGTPSPPFPLSISPFDLGYGVRLRHFLNILGSFLKPEQNVLWVGAGRGVFPACLIHQNTLGLLLIDDFKVGNSVSADPKDFGRTQHQVDRRKIFEEYMKPHVGQNRISVVDPGAPLEEIAAVRFSVVVIDKGVEATGALTHFRKNLDPEVIVVCINEDQKLPGTVQKLDTRIIHDESWYRSHPMPHGVDVKFYVSVVKS